VNQEPLPTIRSRWVRERMRVRELERLLGGPIGTRISDRFDSLQVRVQKAIDRIGEEAEAASKEIRARLSGLWIAALVSAAVLVAAAAAAALLPAYRLWAGLVAAAEVPAVVLLGLGARRLERDFAAARAWGSRYRGPLEEARTAADLQALADRIRSEASVLGLSSPGPAREG